DRWQTVKRQIKVMKSWFQPARNLLLLMLFASSHGADLRPHKQARYLMGTVCEITAYPVVSEDEDPTRAINAPFDELKRIDSLLSNWKTDSELMRMNPVASAPSHHGV